MQTLGISDKQQEPDNFFRRIFWPSNHPADIDALGRRSFWVCLFIAVVSEIQGTYEQQWSAAAMYVLVYCLGGIGVREHSRGAAICVAVFYAVDLAATVVVLHRFPGILAIAMLGLLVGNIRGTWIAARWEALAKDEIPTRFNENWRDWLADQMPARAWPAGKYVFYTVYAISLILIAAGSVMLVRHPPRSQNPDVRQYVVTPEGTTVQ